MPNQLLQNLDVDQQRAALATTGRVAILAVAGAGKTRTITHRIAYAIASDAQPANTGLALSYTTKSAAELKARLASLGVADFATATIHGAAWRQLKHFWPKALGGKPWQLVNNRTRVFEAAAERAGWDMSAIELRSLQLEIEKLKALGLDADTHKDLVSGSDGKLTELWQHYSDYCTTSRLLDFDDMLQLLLGVLQNRPDALREVQQRYQWFTIDEYQDITPLQQQLLDLWVGSSNQICVVGDPTQSIYEFAGAVPNLLKEFVAQPETTVVSLNKTYRVASEIAKVANPIANWLGEQSMQSLHSGGQVTVDVYQSQSAETAAVVQRIQNLNATGVAFGSIAVLLRTGAAVNEMASRLEAANIPVVTRTAGRFIDSKLVKQVLLTLKAAGNTSAEDVFDVVSSAAAGAGWNSIWAESKLPLNDWLGLSSLVELAKLNPESVEDYLEMVGDQVLSLAEPAADAVSVFTIHQAKGLEWDCVVLPGFQEFSGLAEADAISEARVQFVALTRARDKVQISYSATDQYGRVQNLSQFLSGDLPAAPDLTILKTTNLVPPVSEPSISIEFCDRCSSALRTNVEVMTRWCVGCAVDPNTELQNRLTELRSELAAHNGMPAWALISDAALLAMATRPPADQSEIKYFPSLKRLSESELERFIVLFGKFKG